MIIARHGRMPLRLRNQVGDDVCIRRRLRLCPESFRYPRRKRVRSHTFPLLPLSPSQSLVEATEKDNGPEGPSCVQRMNALEEEQD